MKKILIIPLLFVLLASSCSKNDYFNDSGTHRPNFDGNMMEYFNAHAKDSTSLFDSLITIIKLAELETTVSNEQITFFAPTDPSIGKAVKSLNNRLFSTGQDTIKYLSEIDSRAWKRILQGYIIKGDLGLVDFPQVDTLDINAFGGRLYQSLDTDLIVNVGAVYHDLKNGNVVIKYKGPRQLLLSFIPDMSRPTSSWRNAYVASSNIQPTNGRLHVLRFYDHQFGFTESRFTDLVLEYGINYKD